MKSRERLFSARTPGRISTQLTTPKREVNVVMPVEVEILRELEDILDDTGIRSLHGFNQRVYRFVLKVAKAVRQGHQICIVDADGSATKLETDWMNGLSMAAKLLVVPHRQLNAQVQVINTVQ